MSMDLIQTIIPNHTGMIRDGNGRWEQQRGLPRIAGHQQGVQTVKRAVEDCAVRGKLDVSEIDEAAYSHYLYCQNIPNVDLIVRTGGERRLSNFLLWRAANAVFWSMPVLWPDFRKEHLQEAIGIYTKQIRGGNDNA